MYRVHSPVLTHTGQTCTINSMVRVPGLYPVGSGFESLMVYQRRRARSSVRLAEKSRKTVLSGLQSSNQEQVVECRIYQSTADRLGSGEGEAG